MDVFDNLFDAALSGADSIIIDTMGQNIYAQIDGIWGEEPLRAVFDDPDATATLSGASALVENVAPTMFVKTAAITGLKKFDPVTVGETMYWVERISPDDTGSSVVTLARGEPSKPATGPTGWSKK